jgi:cobalt/nickel transport system permease protein
MFADGGITALGANVLNMAVVAPAVAFGVFAVLRGLLGRSLRATLLAAGFAAWCSIVAAAVACAAQLAASGLVDWGIVLPAMAGVHMLIGLGEAVITMLILAVVLRARPELLDTAGTAPGVPRAMAAYGVMASVALVAFVAPLASSRPDGLEHVAERFGFAGYATVTAVPPLADYSVAALANQSPWFSTAVAGGIGTLIAFGVAWLVARGLTTAGDSASRR